MDSTPSPVGASAAGTTPSASDPSSAGVRAATVTVSTVGLVAVGAYVGAQVISQVTSLKIGRVFGRAVDMGTFIYPITFTLRDVVHKALGRAAARTAIWTSAGVNLFLAAYLAWTSGIESDPGWGLGAEYTAVLGPIWRIVLASIVAMVVAETVDTEVYHWFVTRITTRHQWLRVLISNAISVPLDNLIFAVGAFGALPLLGAGALPWDAVWDIFLVNLVVKGLVSVGSIPFIYVVKNDRLAEA